MQQEKEKQRNIDAVDTSEEQLRNQQITEDGNVPKRDEPTTTTQTTPQEDFAPLFEREESERFRAQWLEIQSKFVDDPSVSVQEADDLVADIIKSITRTFADKRIALENQWKSGDNVSTEDLRITMQRYRSFFDRLLTLES